TSPPRSLRHRPSATSAAKRSPEHSAPAPERPTDDRHAPPQRGRDSYPLHRKPHPSPGPHRSAAPHSHHDVHLRRRLPDRPGVHQQTRSSLPHVQALHLQEREHFGARRIPPNPPTRPGAERLRPEPHGGRGR